MDSVTRKALGLIHLPIDGGSLFAAHGADHFLLNHLVLAPVPAIGEAVATYRSLGVTRFLLSFDARDIGRAQAEGEPHGLARFRRAWGVLARLGRESEAPQEVPLPFDTRIRRATAADAAGVGALFCNGFDLTATAAPLLASAIDRPGWDVLVAERSDELAGIGMLFSYERCAYLFGGVVAKNHRRGGIHRALVNARVRLAIEQGAELIGSETGVAVPGKGNPSWNNMVEAGLVQVSRVEHLCPPGATW